MSPKWRKAKLTGDAVKCSRPPVAEKFFLMLLKIFNEVHLFFIPLHWKGPSSQRFSPTLRASRYATKFSFCVATDQHCSNKQRLLWNVFAQVPKLFLFLFTLVYIPSTAFFFFQIKNSPIAKIQAFYFLHLQLLNNIDCFGTNNLQKRLEWILFVLQTPCHYF